jgi:pimeloyl-ACP methyl ester carboxylesterase
VNADEGEKTRKNLAIFIHGFPDSFLLWRYILQSPDLQDHVLVAVDMPGYGGSDSLPQYGPNEVLEAMGDFIVGARELFLQRGGKCVVVSHDWGALVGARLASEAAVLADHWIITSGILVCASSSILRISLTVGSLMPPPIMPSHNGLWLAKCYAHGPGMPIGFFVKDKQTN